MSLLNFPTNPTVGQTYTIGNNTWKWNGTAWVKLTSGTDSPIIINTITNSTSTVTGSLIVVGGAGISGDVTVGGSINVGSTSTIDGSVILTAANYPEYVNLQGVTDGGNSTTNAIVITNTTNATNTQSGALIVSGGGSFGGDLWLGGTLYSAGVPVVTTSTLVESLEGGVDIRIITTQSGRLIFNNTSTLQSVTSRGSSTNQVVTFENTVYFTNDTESTSTDSGAVIITGGLGVGKRINSESVQIADTVIDSTETYINTSTTTLIDSFSAQAYRSAKYFIQVSHGIGGGAEFEALEMILLVDNMDQTYITIYGNVSNNGSLGVYTATVESSVVGLYFTPYIDTEKHVRIFRTGMKI